MSFRSVLAIAALALGAGPAMAQTYTFSCQPQSRTVNGKQELVSLGDQFLDIGRRVFSFDEKARKACEVDVPRRACLPGSIWTGVADNMFTQISFTRERPGLGAIDVLTFRVDSGIFSASILEPEEGEVKSNGKCPP